MHRLGFLPNELNAMLEELKSYPYLKVASVFSHLSASDNPQFDSFTQAQIDLFKSSCEKIEKDLGYKFIKHICNSGAISRFKQAHFDMVRLGIGMYGMGVDEPNEVASSVYFKNFHLSN